jgi:prolyl oligopeptidase
LVRAVDLLLACAFLSIPAFAIPAFAADRDPLAPLGIAPPPLARPDPVSETLFGTRITDPYRYFEQMGPEAVAWMKTQGDYTRRVFDSIGPRAALLQRISDFAGRFGFVQGYGIHGGRAFYQERAPGADEFNLRVRDDNGSRTLVDIGALRARNGGATYAINYFLPAPDGSKVAVGISAGGSEDASLFVYDAATGAQIAGPFDLAEFGATSWSADSKTLYFIRLKKPMDGAAPTDKYLDSTLDAWNLRSEPAPILGGNTGRGPKLDPVENPVLAVIPGATHALLLAVNGVQNEFSAWLAPPARIEDPDLAWQPFFDRDAGITSLELRGDEAFLLSHHDAPTFKVLSLKLGAPLSSAVTLVAPQPNRLVESIHAASDALYVMTLEGNYSHLLRIPTGSTVATEIALPFKGYVSDAFTDPNAPGITITQESWTIAPATFAYDHVANTFTDLHLGVTPAFDHPFVVSDLTAQASDGVNVPLTLIEPNDTRMPRITLLDAYGSYGISQLPGFGPRTTVLLKEGVNVATCHVRGGGELGEQWRLAGKDANKPNTWRDLIACAENLIARGATTKGQLFISGGSAGGIAVGMALTERPDLFAGVIDAVPAANATRSEFSANGPPNIPEFGTITTQEGFTNLYAMDTYQHVKDGTTYPPVLVTTGLNDPRVSSWEPAKFAARLQASGTPNPVLLRIETDGGHGVGATATQADELAADTYSFMFWRAGVTGWRPEIKR